MEPHGLKRSLIPVEKYKEPVKFANDQLHIMWFPDEIKVEKDIQDVLVNFTESEKHGVITTLKLFSLYELFVGAEFWRDRFPKIFEEPEFHRMASVFSMTELAVHAPFYKKINELLHIDNEEFYTSYVQDSALRDRIEFVDTCVDSDDDLVALGAFSMIEGAILYSSFAFLKHFQSQGKNRITNIVRGLNFSVRDENIHAKASAWSFKLKLENSNLSDFYKNQLKDTLYKVANQLVEHEFKIIDMIFEKGSIEGITKIQMQHFIQSRVNEVMVDLGYEKPFQVKYNPVADWFYKGINDYQFNDFFAGQGREYSRNWEANSFTW